MGTYTHTTLSIRIHKDRIYSSLCSCTHETFLLQNEMIFQDVIQLTLSDGPAEGPDGIKVPTTGMVTFAEYWLMSLKGNVM